MRTSFFIAKHYLFSRKRKNVINIISWISLIGLSVGAAALIVVLSVYNGIGGVTQELFNVFDPELIVKPVEGKTFHTGAIKYDAIKKMPYVKLTSELVEENAWATYQQNQDIVELRGVDSNYRAMTRLDTLVYEGIYLLRQPGITMSNGEYRPPVDFLVMGAGIYNDLGLTTTSTAPVTLNIPKRTGAGMGMDLTEAFNTGYAYAAGYFYVQQDVDAKYIVADADFVRSLMNYAPDEVTALALQVDNPKHVKQVKKELRQLLGAEYIVQDHFEQQPLYYKVYHSERLGIYLILSLIVLIATLNLMASLSLLIIDKKHDIGILRSIGMTKKNVRSIFFKEGVMICAIGVVLGLAVGFVVCWVQQKFGLVKMGSGNFVVQSFPVEMRAIDFLTSFLLVMGLSTLAVAFTVKKAKI